MTKPYKEYKVNELKELLKERGLATSGTKSELIARLEEHDEGGDGAPDAAKEELPDETKVPDAAPAAESESSQQETVEAKVNEKAPETGHEQEAPVATKAVEQPESPKLTLEDAIADLEKRIGRNKRFGQEFADLEAQLARVRRFGISAYLATKVNQQLKSQDRDRSRNRRRFKQTKTGVVKNKA